MAVSCFWFVCFNPTIQSRTSSILVDKMIMIDVFVSSLIVFQKVSFCCFSVKYDGLVETLRLLKKIPIWSYSAFKIGFSL